MKRVNTFLIALLLLMFPLQAFAVVDLTLTDESTTDLQTVSVDIDTGTDVVSTISFDVEYSDDVTISEVEMGDVSCDTFNYVDSLSAITISCSLEDPTALSGTLADITFSSDVDIYTFTVLEDDSMDLGTLELGTVVNVGTTDTDTEEDTATEETTPVVENTTTETTTPDTTAETINITEETTSSTGLQNITDYLPYILIAGSVVLLISIVGILLSKKKEAPEEIKTMNPLEKETTSKVQPTKQPPQNTQPTQPKVETKAPPATPQTPQQATPTNEPTLKDMVNQPKIQPAQQGSIQAKPQTTTPEKEAQDLQALNTRTRNTTPNVEAQQAPVTAPPQQTDATPVAQPATPATTEQPEAVIPQTDVGQKPDDLQKQINNEINQMASNGQIPGKEVPQNTQQAPVTDADRNEELPPVPPTM